MSEGGYWAVLTAPILESTEVSDGAKLFYAQITRYTNVRGYCWASNRALSSDLGISERTVTRYVAELCAAGFVSAEDVGVSDRKRRHERRLRVAVPCPFDLAKNGELNVDKIGEVNIDNNGDHYKEYNNKQDNTPHNPPEGGGADLFDRFWALYPKKRNRQAALRAWRKLNPDAELCGVMSRALKRQMRSEDWQRDDGRYIPYPASWINGRRWEDEDAAPVLPRSAEPQEAFGVWR